MNITGYELCEQLYNSSKTLIYRGYRQNNHKSVVIKLLKNPYPTFQELVHFRNQYTIVKNINSPLIIKVYSLESYQNSYALIMEDFGGISLKKYTTKKEKSLQEFLPIAIAITNSLEILHQHHIIHKDIKPSNILINPETKKIKLIDFSIASLLPRETQVLLNPNVLEGTLSYISPEQTGRMNRGIDYRSDFYSLGVTFYELLTGKLPFSSDDPMELVHCHIAKTTSPVHQINPQIPTLISAIVSKLMAKNAEERYQSILGLKYDLEKCWQQLRDTGKIAEFSIAQRDVSEKFIIPDKLYGRELEVKTLLESFTRVSQGATEMMLVAGFSGIGKTAVVNEVHKPIVRQRGYFIKGKYDQLQRNIPFSAFVQAFRDLMNQLLTESQAQIQEWKSKISAALGENGQVIIEVIPELEKIIGQQPPAIELSGTSAQNRFNSLFQKFVRVFTTKQHPLVMFLDDLQWADSSSLNLIQLLMSELKGGYLLLIGAYRDNEVSAIHPFSLCLAELKKVNSIINTITLVPLSNYSLNQLVANTLSCALDISKPLTKLIYQKTEGNPFFSTQFLKILYEDGLIKFERESGNWQCDITKIQELSLSNDVVEFMAQQLKKLPEITQNVLKLAACIGNQFDLTTLAIVLQQSEIEVAACLWQVLQEGLILPQSEIYKFYLGNEAQEIKQDKSIANYKFLHDRVQQAAYSLIPEDQKQITHYKIGQLLLKQISPINREERIFELVNQLNYGIALISQQNERNELAQLNLIACRKAKNATAYQTGSEYARIGLYLLGENAWQQQYEMCLEFHNLAAELASLCGDFESMEQFIEAVVNQTKSLLEQVNAYRIRILANTSQNKLNEAIATGLQFLEKLGVTIPQTPTQNDIQQAITEIGQLIADRKITDLVDLPIMTDREKTAILQISGSIIPSAFISNPPLFPLLSANSIKVSIQYGNTSASVYPYACYGIIACNLLQDINTGVDFGQLALQVVSQLDAKAVKPEALFIVGCFIWHRKFHIKETLPLLQEGYTIGLEVGNHEFAGFSIQGLCHNSLWRGQPLPGLEEVNRTYCNKLVQLNQLTAANWCRIYWQCILNLLEISDHPSILSGEAVEETIFLPLLIKANDWTGLCLFYLFKLMLGYLFGEIEVAKNYAFEARNYLMGIRGTFNESPFYFYDSLVALSQLTPQSAEISQLLEQVEQNQTQLKLWAHYAPMNHQHKVDLVEAEKCRVLGQKIEAIDLYDKAIAGAKANEYIQEQALANELAAKFYLDWGKEKIAQSYLIDAYNCYHNWGAKAKLEDLKKSYFYLLKSIINLQINDISLKNLNDLLSGSTSDSSITSTNISAQLDLETVTKAALAISSEIHIDQLISKLMQVTLENVGADRAALILQKEENLILVADCITFQQCNLQFTLINTIQNLPISIINYVYNSKENVLINDAISENNLYSDPYIIKTKPKSILCTPILNQGQFIGIIYLENSLTTGVFTPERLKILKILSSQSAISLENAQLYSNLEEKVAKRTKELNAKNLQLEQTLDELKRTQIQLIQTEKMSSLGQIVAGVAHEINNPINFIYGNIDHTSHYINDLLRLIKVYQQENIKPSPIIQKITKEIDLDFLIQDSQKILDSMKLGAERISNIVLGLRNFSRLDEAKMKPVDIHQGIDNTLMLLQSRFREKLGSVENIVIKNYAQLPLINCYASQLNQVFMNILNNAIDALFKRSQQSLLIQQQNDPIQIIICTQLVNSDWVRISFQDNGLGMNEETKKRIFDPFFTTKDVGEGTGLGLSISYQIIVEKHGGKIDCISQLGKGTEFLIDIPIKQYSRSQE
ncbi:AAA family ATPase [Anabaena azotica]|uniref:AAA family ATPase n=1 Tax=Anabaena azotica TaxID=197653 RepID=UPI0039A53C49